MVPSLRLMAAMAPQCPGLSLLRALWILLLLGQVSLSSFDSPSL